MRTTVIRIAATIAVFAQFCATGFAQTQVPKSIPCSSSPDGIIGFHEFKPADYGSQKHPLIIFLHGIGERGNGSSQLNIVAYNGLPDLLARGASMKFTVNGKTSSFVVLSPQLSLSYGYWPTFYAREMIKYAKANLQIDTNRIYVTGLSLGGGGIWRLITEAPNWDYSFDAGIAAAAPVCGTQEESDADFCATIGNNHLPVWAFHAIDDPVVGVNSTQHAEALANICGLSPAAKFTYYASGGHAGAWLNAYDTGHITTTLSNGSSFTATTNLYEWLLSHTRATAPVAVPGPAQQNINGTSTILSASGSYSSNGAITSYNWQQVAGPATTLLNANTVSPTVTNMAMGNSYQFKLTVTDYTGASGSAVTNVSVMSLLPVEFNYFRAVKGSNATTLQWQTANEQGNAYFVVERSSDGANFSSIAQVNGSGTTTATNDYSYIDTKAAAGNVYYRLKQVDKNGSFTYSKIVMVTITKSGTVQFYPSPVQNNLNIVLDNDTKGNGKIIVHDLTGRTVQQQIINKNDKLFNASINMNMLSSGMYIVDVKIGDSYQLTQRIVKE